MSFCARNTPRHTSTMYRRENIAVNLGRVSRHSPQDQGSPPTRLRQLALRSRTAPPRPTGRAAASIRGIFACYTTLASGARGGMASANPASTRSSQATAGVRFVTLSRRSSLRAGL